MARSGGEGGSGKVNREQDEKHRSVLRENVGREKGCQDDFHMRL